MIRRTFLVRCLATVGAALGLLVRGRDTVSPDLVEARAAEGEEAQTWPRPELPPGVEALAICLTRDGNGRLCARWQGRCVTAGEQPVLPPLAPGWGRSLLNLGRRSETEWDFDALDVELRQGAHA
jgi:hypothetical protein